MKEMICIVCPLGCRLRVDDTGEKIVVSGNRCQRGEKYAIEEITAPKRLITSIVPVKGGIIPMVSVKSSAPFPKDLIFPALELLKKVELTAPIKLHQVIVHNVCDTGVDFIATKEIKSKESK